MKISSSSSASLITCPCWWPPSEVLKLCTSKHPHWGEFDISKRFFYLLNFFTFMVIVIVGVKISPIFSSFSFDWKSKSRVTNMFQGCFKEFSKISTMVSKMFQRYFRDAWCSNNVHRYLKMVSPQRCFLQIMFKYISNIFSHQMCWKI